LTAGPRQSGRDKFVALVVAPLLLGILLASSAPWWLRYIDPGRTPASTPNAGAPLSQDSSPALPEVRVVGFIGGCSPYRVVSQNRYNPPGARKLIAPDVLSQQVGGFRENEIVVVDGWVHGSVAYPYNRPPFNNDIWFHLADDSGWVSFAAVRANPTALDPTGFDEDGGTPAVAPMECEGAIQ